LVFVNPPSPAPKAPSLLREITGSLLAIVFPSTCSLCNQELTDVGLTGVCGDCWDSLEAWSGPLCPGCGLPLVADHSSASLDTRCGDCRVGEFTFDRARSFGLYRDLLRAFILHLKFHRRERLGTRLGRLLAVPWKSVVDTLDCGDVQVVPVPLHPGRQRERGYNQAELLSRGLAQFLLRSRQLPVPRIDSGILRKTRATAPQTGLSVAARRENVRGAFDVPSPGRVRDRVVVLVDDVMTTGATLSACALALKNAGARQVLGITLARATPQFPDSGPPPGTADIDGIVPRRP
jgi:ComF family protein